jgi:phospholipid/cholesterol/gamma-HCH transport system substrate-binding protein
MRRRRGSPVQAIASSPTMVGAITTLIVVVAVFLAYNANSGLPFVPVYRVSVMVPNAARVTHDNEIRIGGTRVGVIESVEPVRTTHSGELISNTSEAEAHPGTCCVAAMMNLKIDKAESPIPEDSIFRVRYKSTFGLKYLEIVRGTGPSAPEGFVFNGLDDTGECPLPTDLATFSKTQPKTSKDGCFQPQTEFDAIANTFNHKTRNAARAGLIGFGNAFAARGASVNEAIDRLGPLFRNANPVAKTLAAPSTKLERFITSLARTAHIVAPVAAQQSDFFTQAAIAFDAIDPQALRATIIEARPLLEEGPAELARQRPFLADVAELARRLRPGVGQLRLALPDLNSAVVTGAPVLARSVGTSHDLRTVFSQLLRTIQQPATKISLQRLRETFDQAKPLAAWVVPAQTVCNYWNYDFTELANALSDRDRVGFTFRQSQVNFPIGTTNVSVAPGTEVSVPGPVEAGLPSYAGIQANGIDGMASPTPGKFDPFTAPILQAHAYAPTGQRHADCQPGQTGYYFGDLRIPGQPPSSPAQVIPDIPGSRGPTTRFTKQNGTRILKDTRISSHQLTGKDR